MVQLAMFDESGAPTLGALPAGQDQSAACSAEALGKVDVTRLERLTEQEYRLFPDGAIAEEIVENLRCRGVEAHGNLVTIGSIRPRQTALKKLGILVETGKRRSNDSGNSCAVLIHRDYVKEEA